MPHDGNKVESVKGWLGLQHSSPLPRLLFLQRTDPTSASLELTLLPGPKPFASRLQVEEKTWLPSAITGELFIVLFTYRWLSIIWIHKSVNISHEQEYFLTAQCQQGSQKAGTPVESILIPTPRHPGILAEQSHQRGKWEDTQPSLPIAHSLPFWNYWQPRFITSFTVCFMPMALSSH